MAVGQDSLRLRDSKRNQMPTGHAARSADISDLEEILAVLDNLRLFSINLINAFLERTYPRQLRDWTGTEGDRAQYCWLYLLRSLAWSGHY